MLRGWRTEVLHAHTLGDALYSSWLFARLRGLPLIFEMTLMGTDDALSFADNRNRFNRLRNRIFRLCDGYVAISPALARAYERAGLPQEKLRVIPQGVDVERFRPAEDVGALRERLGIPMHGEVVMFVGSLIERKGIDLLLAAWEKVSADSPDATLVMVGPNEFADDPTAAAFLEDHLGRLSEGARRRVLQAGVRPDVEEYLRAADLFAFPSRREGFGTVMIEAMATGLPCVVAELADITDYIFAADGNTGMVVPPDDADALARGLSLLLADPDRAATMGAAARQRVAERFSVTRVADDYLDFYAGLAARRGGG
jgi:glycosyltransferase involved in cell wall biosynthesis